MSTRRDSLTVAPTKTVPDAARARTAVPNETADLRIELRRPGGVDTFVDGGWWPRSLDLTAELPSLVAAVEAAGYREVHRVSYALTAWNGPPLRTAVRGRVIKLGGFRSQDPAEVALVDSSGWRRVTIAVIPPDADPAAARRALALAGTNGDRHDAREILDLSRG